MTRLATYILMFLIVQFASVFTHAQQFALPEVMPSWSLYNQAGERVSSDQFAGKPLVLHFWATWCPHCKRVQPALDRLVKDYEDRGLQVLAVSFNEQPGADPQGELERRNLSLQTVVNGEALAFEKFSIIGTPTTIFIAPDGRVLGATMQSDPDDPQWQKVADYLVSLMPKFSSVRHRF